MPTELNEQENLQHFIEEETLLSVFTFSKRCELYCIKQKDILTQL